MYRFILFSLCLVLTACSDNSNDIPIEEPATLENVFQTQIDALDKAKETEKMMLDVMEKQRQIIEDNGG